VTGHRTSGREWLAVAGLLALFAVAAGAGLLADSSVADEHPHILSGYLYWKTGRFAGGLDNPPLGQLIVAAPLVILNVPYRFPADTGLALCRLPVVVAGLGLGLLLWRWGRALGGPAVGLLALAGLCFEPNLLAHGHLATLDFLLTLAWWAALWCWRGAFAELERASAGDGGDTLRLRWLAGFAWLFAVGTMVKLTAVFLLPAVALAAIVAGRGPGVGRRVVVGMLLAVVATVLVAYGVYGLGTPVRWGLPAGLVDAVRGKLEHRGEVHFAYLAGRRSDRGFLIYYLVALLVKTPLPLLALAGWGSVRLLRTGAWREGVLLWVPALAVVAVFTFIRVNVGVRHVLPVFPALLLLAAVGLRAGLSGRRGRVLVFALACWWVTGVVRVAPQDLAYFNLLAGGPANGHRWLLDSNLDWGQDDGRLARFLASPQGQGFAVDPDPLVPRTGRLAVSSNALHNLQRRTARPDAWLRPCAVQGFAGYSWRLYELDRDDFERLVTARPQDPAAAWGLASVVAAVGDGRAADRVFMDAAARLTRAADRVELAVLASRTATRRDDWESARSWAQRGLDVRPGDPELQALLRWADLELALGRAGGEDAGRIAWELGLHAAAIGETAVARSAIERAARLLPDDPEVQRGLAVSRTRLGDYAGAQEILDRPDLASRFPDERVLCGALADAQEALERGRVPIPTDLLFELGRSHFEGERYDAAAAAFVQLLRQDPGHRLAMAYLCEMQVRSKMRIVEQRLRPRSLP